MKTIYVTGAGGFIGSHLAEQLVSSGYSVKAFVRYNSRNTWGWIDESPLRNDMEVICGDIRDADFINRTIRGCDSVFHLAALIGIPYSYDSPKTYIETNVMGTYNILEAARNHNLENVVITSTSEVYGTAQYVPIDELHPRSAQSPYAATKTAADQLAISYHRSFGLPVKIVRPFNTYGPRQSARAVIPSIITQLIKGKTSIKLGSLHPTRDLLFVKDTVAGFIAIAKSINTIGEEINIATQSEISIASLAKKIIGLINPTATIVTDEKRIRPQGSEVERLLGANAKIKSLTDWQPQFSIDEGLVETVEWFKNIRYQDMYKEDIYNV